MYVFGGFGTSRGLMKSYIFLRMYVFYLSMKRLIGVSVPLRKNILIFPNDVHGVPKSISGWRNTSNHFSKVSKEIYRS